MRVWPQVRSGVPMISQPVQNPPAPGYSGPPPAMQQYQVPPAVQTSYAGIWIRLVSRIVVAIAIVAALSGGALSAASSSDQNTQNAAAGVAGGAFGLVYLLALVLVVGYQVYFWGTSGQTIAMRLFHLKLV